jgi:hypothetical protein
MAETRLIRPADREKIRRKDGLSAKYNALAKIFDGALDRRPVYAKHVALTSLRNCLIHRSADYLEPGQWPLEVAPHKGVIPHVQGTGLDWTSQVLARVTAQWALDTAVEFLTEVDEHIPDPGRHPFVDSAGA